MLGMEFFKVLSKILGELKENKNLAREKHRAEKLKV